MTTSHQKPGVELPRFVCIEGRVTLSLCWMEHHVMKMYWGSGDIASHILDLSISWRWMVSFMLWPLYPQGKSPWYPLDRMFGGPQSCSGCSGEEKNSQPQPEIEPKNPNCPACSLVTIPTELSRLLYIKDTSDNKLSSMIVVWIDHCYRFLEKQ
jgi:hypothetical protein